MTAEDQKAFEDEIYAFVGREVCPPTPARDDVNTAMIRQWTEIIGDTNPAYTDAGWAANSARGKTIAPPAMMYVWGQEGFAVTTGRPADAQSDLVSLFNQHGYTGVLGTNVKQEYFKEVSPGDNVVMAMTIDNISERKTTGRGPGYFFETLATFSNQHGEKIGTPAKVVMRHPVLSCDANDFLSLALQQMLLKDVQRLFVYKDDPARIVGVLSLSDSARFRSGSCRACTSGRLIVGV